MTTSNLIESDPQDVDIAVARAAAAAAPFAAAGYRSRARLLTAIADRLDAAADEVVPIAHRETHIAQARLTGELARTSYQLRAFARLLLDGRQLGISIEHSDPAFPLAGPSPDLRSVMQPLGPVAVFAASNFPFAFSVAGGDTASALAAGCPVIVKAHPGHPQLARATADVVHGAVIETAFDAGVFALVEGHEAGVRLLRHPDIRAAAFTGSTPGGRALFDIASSRPVPIPFYGELGSINPVYVSREAMDARRGDIVAGFVDSYTLAAGQLCTKPGLIFVPRGEGFAAAARERVNAIPAARLLNDRIAASYTSTGDLLAAVDGVDVVAAGVETDLGHAPTLLATTIDTFLENVETLTTERFGPSALVVEYDDVDRLPAAATAVGGTLTSTIHAQHLSDRGIETLVGAAVRESGRVIWNGWPTGVTVSPAMMHGGPYPASTSPLHTSVGLTAVARFLRPVVFQGFPDEALPPELQEANPLGLTRSVDILRS